MMLWEIVSPKRQLKISKSYRWVNNIALVVFNTLLMRLILPVATVGVALFASQYQIGLFSNVALPLWAKIILCIFIMDLVIYWQHRLFHKIPILWRLHRVHHVDQDIDVTTGSRFHPIEILLSLLIKFIIILILGVPAEAVILFEIILNGTAMFNHSNVELPKKIDKYLRWVLVTPDMHRVHHSSIKQETNSNYGFNIPHWDRIFGSYIDQPKLGHHDVKIGVQGYEDVSSTQNLFKLLIHPFSK